MENKTKVILPKETLKSRDLLEKNRINMLHTINSTISHLYYIDNYFVAPRDIAYMEYRIIDQSDPIECCARYFRELRMRYESMPADVEMRYYEKKMSDLLETVAKELHQIATTDYSDTCGSPLAYDFMVDVFTFHCSHCFQRNIVGNVIRGYGVSAIIAFALESLRNELYSDIFDWENVHTMLSEMLSEEE